MKNITITTEDTGTATITIPATLNPRTARLAAEQALAEARGLTTDQLANYWEYVGSGTATTLTYIWVADDYGPAL